jgi:phosphatidylethanolamine-binding protein (PEBP) family uncharacterized protein
MTLKLISPAFSSGDDIPAKFTCEGADVSPPLKWENSPVGTNTYAIILEGSGWRFYTLDFI